MSRQINPESVLSEDEIRYLEERGHETVLAQNAAYLINRHDEEAETGSQTPEGSGDGDTGGDGSTPASDDDNTGSESDGPGLYDTLKKDQLTAEIARRNAEREGTEAPQIEPTGSNKPELIAALEADDTRTLAADDSAAAE